MGHHRPRASRRTLYVHQRSATGRGGCPKAAGGVERGRWGCLAGAAARPPPLALSLPRSQVREFFGCRSLPCAENRLVPRYARFLARGLEQMGLQNLGAEVGVASMFGGLGPAAGRCPGSLAAARTARPPPGPRASLLEPRIFRPGPLVSIGRVRTSRPASETYPGCLERVRAGAVASMAHKMGHRKRLPKTMRLQPQK